MGVLQNNFGTKMIVNANPIVLFSEVLSTFCAGS